MNEGERVIAWLSLQSFLPRCAYAGTAEVSVYVREDFRRCGVARCLIDKAIESAAALEITALVGHVFAHNEPESAFFREGRIRALGIFATRREARRRGT